MVHVSGAPREQMHPVRMAIGQAGRTAAAPLARPRPFMQW